MAATFDLSLVIGGDSKEAIKSLDDLDKEFKDLKKSVDRSSDSLEQNQAKLDKVSDKSEKAAERAKTLSSEMSKLGRNLSSLGGSITALTLPLSGLAALSLSNVFKLGEIENAEGQFKEFAVSVNLLKDNFTSLTVEIGQKLIPVIQPFINFATSLVSEFRRLDDETKELIGTIGLVAGAFGPMLLIVGKLVSTFGTLIPIFTAAKTAIASVVTIISSLGVVLGSLIAVVAGTVNVFLKLKEAGVDSAQAIEDAFLLLVKGFGSYIVANLAKAISVVMGMLAQMAGAFSSEIEANINKAVLYVGQFAEGLDSSFQQHKSKIDGTLEKVGSSAGDAFTFGLSSKLSDWKNKIKEMFSGQDIEGLNLGLADALKKEEKQVKQSLTEMQMKAKELEASIVNNMTNAFMSFSEGAESAEQAFKKMALAIIADIKRMAIQMAITRSLFPQGGLAAMVPAGYASGGYVRGAGTSTSDSIPARLSNGEFVVRAAAVKSVGVGFLNAINSLGSRRRRPQRGNLFAEGGSVSASGGSNQVSVNVVNNGTEKDVIEASYDPQTMVVSIILDDLNRNGAISKGIGGTFGISRGDFR